ncbi:MAG: YggS family pyridoxal phosphate-dependent enzyme [Smithellaceae bacterium]|nr:YggS family pyridoxal phosphate-dependent enzyme [Smithellaceae bacterium]
MSGSVRENIQTIRQRITEAAARAGRKAEEVKLMAITKTVPDDLIGEAIAAAVDLIGENYVQEAQRKIEIMGRTLPWHLTGHLQTNKAKYAVNLFEMIHSLDRLALARELDRRAAAAGLTMAVLIEVNTGGEATKSGIPPGEAIPLIREVAKLSHLAIRGLMTMPPWFADPQEARPFFRALRLLRDQVRQEAIPGVEMTELSMGMSDDFEVAVEEGATIVRVGRAIFGARKFVRRDA